MVRVLLDEDMDVRLRHHFGEGAEVETVEYRGWKGLRNGPLLRVAEQKFDILVTMDDRLPSQQNLEEIDLAVVILRAKSKTLPDLLELMPEVRQRLSDFKPGAVVRIYPPGLEGS